MRLALLLTALALVAGSACGYEERTADRVPAQTLSVFRTPDGNELQILDSARRECERDERLGCEVHLSALETVSGERWTGELRKRSGPATDVTVRVVFAPVET